MPSKLLLNLLKNLTVSNNFYNSVLNNIFLYENNLIASTIKFLNSDCNKSKSLALEIVK